MSDLRTRITAAIQANLVWDAPKRSELLADAVISDLGLRQETTYAWRNVRTYPAGTRYVSEWERNE
jgi:hypothetical protein